MQKIVLTMKMKTNPVNGICLRFLLIFLLLTGVCLQNYGQDYFSGSEPKGKNHILLLHPTRTNLDRYSYLLKNRIIPLPDSIIPVWVFSSNSTADYPSSFEEYPEFRFHRIQEDVHPDSLYTENVLTPLFEKLFRNSTGVIFNGGPDIPPSYYGKNTGPLTQIRDPGRHRMEISFLFHLLGSDHNELYTPLLEEEKDYLILGICLGMQTMNVATGGTLIQDIPSEIYKLEDIESILGSDPHTLHRNYRTNLFPEDGTPSYFPHPVSFSQEKWEWPMKCPDSLTLVLSSHHQAIEKTGKGITPIGWSSDQKIIEVVKHNRYPCVMGFQFHPELPWIYNRSERLNYPGLGIITLTDFLAKSTSLNFHYDFWKMVCSQLKP